MPQKIVDEPTVEPVTVEQAKKQLNITSTDDDQFIENLIVAVRIHVETKCKIALITQTWDYFTDFFPRVIELPKSPISSVTTVKYTDTAGVQQTLASSVYTVDTNSEPGRIFEAYNQTWPNIQSIRNAVEIRYVAGYGANGNSVPEPLLHAIKMLVGHYYENREAGMPIVINEVPMGFGALISPYIITRFC